MTKNNEARTSRKKIDHNGNIVEKGYGASRWARARQFGCEHDDCTNNAVVLSAIGKAHNCCAQHERSGKDD